ncbi:hypothetical protein [Mediterraneibacter agrestimuris]|uniref:hypothetical protein n=1 Tax=Mediterraneibacter agrestimuris TaxID=2941333 RepID=UPI00203C123A|nr:hypothetical protein [Mediterraneibacter agrestimuris]
MKRKIVSIISLCFLMIGFTAIPVYAGNSYLDIKHGDIYSFTEGKDDWDTNFYITPTTYVGDYVRVRSRCLSSGDSCSAYQQVNRSLNLTSSYKYGTPVYPGLLYQMDGYGAPGLGWHLVGTWCP